MAAAAAAAQPARPPPIHAHAGPARTFSWLFGPLITAAFRPCYRRSGDVLQYMPDDDQWDAMVAELKESFRKRGIQREDLPWANGYLVADVQENMLDSDYKPPARPQGNSGPYSAVHATTGASGAVFMNPGQQLMPPLESST